MEISVLQEKIKEMKMLRDQYDGAKRELDLIGSKCDQIEFEILTHFQENGLSNFRMDGVANVSITERISVQTPKTIEEKEAFFSWVKNNKGEDVMKAMQTVNSQTLNSFYKQEYDSLSDDEKLCFKIDGLNPHSVVQRLSVRKA